jgi:glycosyltransferase involved in cell wall biosynthesis
MEKVSVIIPTHNRSKFLRAAITSVLNQTYQDFELIVVDDASTDNTAETVTAFKDARIKFIHHETNKGGSAARNTGILHSSGDYIAFLDDDDEWLPEKLARQLDILRSSPSELGCVYTGYLDVDGNTGKVVAQQIPTKHGDLSKDLLIENCVGSASSVCLKRECLAKVGLFDETLPCSQDYDLWMRIAKQFRFACVQAPLFKYSIHNDKISTNTDARTKGLELIQSKYSSSISGKYFSNAYNDLGIKHCLAGDMNRGRTTFIKAITFSPCLLRGYFNLCLSLCGSQIFRRVKGIERKLSAAVQKGSVSVKQV